jgi:hypothetical protein
MDFARTQHGHRFFEHTLPGLVREVGRLADALGRLAEATTRLAGALERLDASRPATPREGP